MKIHFNLMAEIDVFDADCFPPQQEVLSQLFELFSEEGLIAQTIGITNYRMMEDDDE